MIGITRFKAGELVREIAIRGKSFGEFAQIAGVDAGTLSKAARGETIRPKTGGKILAGLGRTPILEGAENLFDRRSA